MAPRMDLNMAKLELEIVSTRQPPSKKLEETIILLKQLSHPMQGMKLLIEVSTLIVKSWLPSLLEKFHLNSNAALLLSYLTSTASYHHAFTRLDAISVLELVKEILLSRARANDVRKYAIFTLYVQTFPRELVFPYLSDFLKECVYTLCNETVSEVFQALQVLVYFNSKFTKFMEEKVDCWFVPVFQWICTEKSNVRRLARQVFTVNIWNVFRLSEVDALHSKIDEQIVKLETMARKHPLEEQALTLGLFALFSVKKLHKKALRMKIHSIAIDLLKMGRSSKATWYWRLIIESYAQAKLNSLSELHELMPVLIDSFDSPSHDAFKTWTYLLCAFNHELFDFEKLVLVTTPFLESHGVKNTQLYFFLSLFFGNSGDEEMNAPQSYFQEVRLRHLLKNEMVPCIVRLPRTSFCRLLPKLLKNKWIIQILNNPSEQKLINIKSIFKQLKACDKTRSEMLNIFEEEDNLVILLPMFDFNLDVFFQEDNHEYNSKIWLAIAGTIEVWKLKHNDDVVKYNAALHLLEMPLKKDYEYYFKYSSAHFIWSKLLCQAFQASSLCKEGIRRLEEVFHDIYHDIQIFSGSEFLVARLFRRAIENATIEFANDSRQCQAFLHRWFLKCILRLCKYTSSQRVAHTLFLELNSIASELKMVEVLMVKDDILGLFPFKSSELTKMAKPFLLHIINCLTENPSASYAQDTTDQFQLRFLTSCLSTSSIELQVSAMRVVTHLQSHSNDLSSAIETPQSKRSVEEKTKQTEHKPLDTAHSVRLNTYPISNKEHSKNGARRKEVEPANKHNCHSELTVMPRDQSPAEFAEYAGNCNLHYGLDRKVNDRAKQKTSLEESPKESALWTQDAAQNYVTQGKKTQTIKCYEFKSYSFYNFHRPNIYTLEKNNHLEQTTRGFGRITAKRRKLSISNFGEESELNKGNCQNLQNTINGDKSSINSEKTLKYSYTQPFLSQEFTSTALANKKEAIVRNISDTIKTLEKVNLDALKQRLQTTIDRIKSLQ